MHLQINHHRMRLEHCTIKSRDITVNKMYLVGTQSRHLRTYVFGVVSKERLILISINAVN